MEQRLGDLITVLLQTLILDVAKFTILGKISTLHVSTDKQRWRKLSMLGRIYNLHVSIGKQ